MDRVGGMGVFGGRGGRIAHGDARIGAFVERVGGMGGVGGAGLCIGRWLGGG